MPRFSPSARRPAARGPRAFTLVEMLVVMGIIVLLVAALLPAVRGLNNSSSRRGAVGTLLGTLDRARMMAINDNLATYVVFAPGAGDGQQFRPDLRGRAYAIYEDHDNITFMPEQRTPWTQLPNGLAFKVSDATVYASITNQTPASTSFPVTAAALAAGSGSSGLRLPYWKFGSTGAVEEASGSCYQLLVFPGVIDGSGNEVPTQNGSGAANKTLTLFEQIDVNPATGRARYNIDPLSNHATPTPTP